MFDAFNRHDWKVMTEFYGDTASFLDPSFGTFDVKKSRIETATKFTEMQKMFPDLHDEVVTLFSQGDKVAVEFISTSMRGDQKFTLPICTIFTIQNGKIVRDATYYNNCQE
jgi:ketosteroid isomerase-like protein